MSHPFFDRLNCSAAATLEALGHAVLVVSVDNHDIIDCNERAVALFRATRDWLFARCLTDLFAPGDVSPFDLEIATIERPMVSSDGGVFDAAMTVGPPLCTPSATVRMIAVRDVSERKRLEREAEFTERKFSNLFDVSPDAMLISELETGLAHDINPSFTKMFGFERHEVIGRTTLEMGLWPSKKARDEAVATVKETGQLRSYEADLVTKDGRIVNIQGSSAIMMIDGRPHTLAQFRDVTERKAHLRALEHLAHHDPLTGLPNRRQFTDRLAGTFDEARRENHRFALLLLDLDGFKEVNDALGHPAGDELLTLVSERLRECLEDENAFLARLGGDEFAVVLYPCTNHRAEIVARGLRRTIRRAYELRDMRIDIGVSVGIAMYPEHGDDPTTLLRRADTAMYAAKRSHAGWGWYDPADDMGSVERLTLMSQLKDAIRGDQLRLHWQPKVRLSDGAVAGAEGLVRWRHPRLGLLGPGAFVPAAEMGSLINGLTDWVVADAARQVREWADRGVSWPVSVNLSARNLVDETLPERIALALARYDVDMSRIEFEITETAFMSDPKRAFSILSRMTDQGARFAIDDFGTGYASLATLRLLPPVSALKIDRCFVGRMVVDPADAAVVETIVGLTRRLRIACVAEGVEDGATFDMLRDMGCDEAQGYWISRPTEADAMLDWAATRQ